MADSADCTLWTGYIDRDGYGHCWFDGKMRMAHRVEYEKANGPIPDGMEIDHLCRNRACVQPEHLEAVPHIVNVRRGRNAQRDKTHCGTCQMPFDEGNTIYLGSRRLCRNCRRKHWRNQYQKKRQKKLAVGG